MIARSPSLGRLLAAWLALAASAASAEPLTLDRLLRTEDLGASALSPDRRHLVIETRAPYDQAPRFDFETSAASLGRLMVADLASGAPARPLFAADPKAGYTAGPFSPSGRRMIVSRWKGRRWDTGVVEVASGAVRWLDFGIEQPLFGRTLQWLSDDAFVAIALWPDDPPLHLKLGWQNQARTAALWSAQALGRVPTVQTMASGRARRPEPRRDRQLVRVDLPGGAPRVLARGGFFDLEVSPGGRFVAALGEDERIGLVATPALRMGAPSRRRALTIIDLATGQAHSPCAHCTTLTQPLAWSPRGDRLLVFQHDAARLEDTGALTVVEARSGRATAIGAPLRPAFNYGGEGLATVRADWLGERPILLGREGEAARIDWYALGGPAPLNLTGALSAPPDDIALGERSLLSLAAGEGFAIDAAGQARRLPGAGTRWFRPAPFGTGLRPSAAPIRDPAPLRHGDGGIIDLTGAVTASPSEATLIAVEAGATIYEQRHPSGVRQILMAKPGRPPLELLTLNADLAQLEQGQVKSLETATPDGRRLKSWLYLPADWRPGMRPPLVVVPYPGSAPQRFPFRFTLGSANLTPSPPLLAAQGYAVLAPALPRDRSRGEPAEGLADQILAIVDAAVAAGYADPERLALWGHSFGGYAGLVTATQTARFKAIVVQAGPADFLSNWGAVQPYFVTAPEDGGPSPIFMGYNETGQGALKGPPWRETARYLRNSPLHQADRIVTPLMLIYGDQDFVGLAQGQAMFNALYRQDKDATLLTLLGEGHLPTSPANIRAVYAEVLPWLAERLRTPPAAGREERPSQ